MQQNSDACLAGLAKWYDLRVPVSAGAWVAFSRRNCWKLPATLSQARTDARTKTPYMLAPLKRGALRARAMSC